MRSTNPLRLSLVVTTFAMGALLTSCSETPAEKQDEMQNKMENVQEEMNDVKTADTRAEWENERTDVLDKLRNMRDDIDGELDRCNERLADKGLKASQRTDETAMQAELTREKARVEELIVRVEGSNEGTWMTVKEDTRKTSDEVEGWWARQKENIDKKTDADKDNDGH